MSTKKLQIVNRVITTDETLTLSGIAADAKAVGDAIADSIETSKADWNETDETNPAFIQNKPVEETEDDAIDMLAEMGILDPVTDEEDNILTDENGNILTI